MSTYEPGTNAIITTARGEVRAYRTLAGRWITPGGGHVYYDAQVTAVRILPTIDYNDREQVERLHALWCAAIVSKGTSAGQIDNLQAALREYANPTPPKPAEPTGLGAVVEDADGALWVRLTTRNSGACWKHSDLRTLRAPYADFAATKVLSEGVTP